MPCSTPWADSFTSITASGTPLTKSTMSGRRVPSARSRSTANSATAWKWLLAGSSQSTKRRERSRVSPSTVTGTAVPSRSMSVARSAAVMVPETMSRAWAFSLPTASCTAASVTGWVRPRCSMRLRAATRSARTSSRRVASSRPRRCRSASARGMIRQPSRDRVASAGSCAPPASERSKRGERGSVTRRPPSRGRASAPRRFRARGPRR